MSATIEALRLKLHATRRELVQYCGLSRDRIRIWGVRPLSDRPDIWQGFRELLAARRRDCDEVGAVLDSLGGDDNGDGNDGPRKVGTG
jgi:hypothetical protein